jgi:hypothetical protein
MKYFVSGYFVLEIYDKHKWNSEWDILDLDILYNKKYLGNR